MGFFDHSQQLKQFSDKEGKNYDLKCTGSLLKAFRDLEWQLNDLNVVDVRNNECQTLCIKKTKGCII